MRTLLAVLALSCVSMAQINIPSISGTPTAGQCAYWVTSKKLGGQTCATGGGEGGAVDSVFGRTGIVVAQSGDYSAFYALQSHNHLKAQITDFPTTWDWSAIDNKPLTFPATSHNHVKADITDFPVLATVATSGSYTDLTNKPINPANITVLWNGVLAQGTKYPAIPAGVTLSIPTNCASSTLKLGIAPTGTVVFSLKKNGVQFGTATFAASTTPTYSCTATTLASGDLFEMVDLSGLPDATAADLRGSIYATR